MIRPYLSDMINDHKAPMKLRVYSSKEVIDYETQFGECKIQLTMQINFISSKDFEETCTKHTKSDNIEIMIGKETDDIIKELSEYLLQRYQEGLEKKMKGSKFVLDNVDLLYYHLHKTSLRRGKSYIKSPEWLKNKRATIYLKNKKDDNCFQYVLTVAFNWEKIVGNPPRISKIKAFISQYEWKGMDFPSHLKDWKKFEQNNKTIALNILYVLYNTKEIGLARKLKYNHKRDNQVILLMITDGEKWHYLAVKILPALLRRIPSNHNGDFYSSNCFHS